jgi:hypothetical protein
MLLPRSACRRASLGVCTTPVTARCLTSWPSWCPNSLGLRRRAKYRRYRGTNTARATARGVLRGQPAQRRPCDRHLFNNGGALPPAFGAPLRLARRRSHQCSGQVSAEPPPVRRRCFHPFVDGRCGIGGTDHPPLGYVPIANRGRSAPARGYLKAAAPTPLVYEPRWSVWGAGYGGGNHTNGDAVIGSHDCRRARRALRPRGLRPSP